MENIKAFLLPPVMDETKEVVITKRAKYADGKPIPFVIRVIDQETNNRLIKLSTTKKKVNGQVIHELDNEKYGKLLVDACVVSPNFKTTEMCEHYKVVDPLDVPGRMLTVGEYNRLVSAIKDINDLVTTEDDLHDMREEVKNL